MAGVCLFGGAFDPPHISHRRIAEAVLARPEIDELIVMPCGDHPLKPACKASSAMRLRMCKQNFNGLDHVSISDLEIRRAGKSYSVDTLAEMHAAAQSDVQLFFLIGSDNAQSLCNWHDYARMFELAQILVLPRSGYPCDANSLANTCLNKGQQRHLLAGLIDWEPDAVQSSEIRRRLHAGETCDWLLPEVAAVIDTEGLYRDGPG